MKAIVVGRILVAYVLAVLVAYLLAAMAATQSVLASLEEMGVVVSLGERLATTGADLIGMFPTYGIIIAVALAIALPIATTRWPFDHAAAPMASSRSAARLPPWAWPGGPLQPGPSQAVFASSILTVR